MNEADTCRRLVVPKLQTAGWETDRIESTSRSRSPTGGSWSPAGKPAGGPASAPTTSSGSARTPIAVVEAKPAYKTPGDALQQGDRLVDREVHLAALLIKGNFPADMQTSEMFLVGDVRSRLQWEDQHGATRET